MANQHPALIPESERNHDRYRANQTRRALHKIGVYPPVSLEGDSGYDLYERRSREIVSRAAETLGRDDIIALRRLVELWQAHDRKPDFYDAAYQALLERQMAAVEVIR